MRFHTINVKACAEEAVRYGDLVSNSRYPGYA